MSDLLSAVRRCILVVLIATTLLSLLAYVRAIWRDDEIAIFFLDDRRHYHSISLVNYHGTLGVLVIWYALEPGYSYIDPGKPPPPRTELRHFSVVQTKDLAGIFDVPTLFDRPSHSFVDAGTTDSNIASIPALTLALLAGFWPAIVWIKLRRARAIARLGKCKRCGYDLRGTFRFCPECGRGREKPS